MNDKDAYQKKMEAKLEEWDSEIDRMKAKAKQAEADTQIKYEQQINEMQAKKQAARAKIDELKNAGSSAWEQLKTGVERAMDDLERAIKSNTSK